MQQDDRAGWVGTENVARMTDLCEPLLREARRAGKRLPPAEVTIDEARDYARKQIDRLPGRIRRIESAGPPIRVELSPALEKYRDETTRDIQSGERKP